MLGKVILPAARLTVALTVAPTPSTQPIAVTDHLSDVGARSVTETVSACSSSRGPKLRLLAGVGVSGKLMSSQAEPSMVLVLSKVNVFDGGVIPAGETMRFTMVSDRTCTSAAYKHATLAAF